MTTNSEARLRIARIGLNGPQPGTSDWAGKVHAAIAKAEGRS